MFIVFLATVFWHGASWNFIVWGMWHGIFIVIERYTKFQKNEKIPNLVKHIYTLLVVNIGWVFFRAENLEYAIEFLKKMFFISTEYTAIYDPRYYLSNNVIIVMIIGILMSASVFKNTLNLEME